MYSLTLQHTSEKLKKGFFAAKKLDSFEVCIKEFAEKVTNVTNKSTVYITISDKWISANKFVFFGSTRFIISFQRAQVWINLNS